MANIGRDISESRMRKEFADAIQVIHELRKERDKFAELLQQSIHRHRSRTWTQEWDDKIAEALKSV